MIEMMIIVKTMTRTDGMTIASVEIRFSEFGWGWTSVWVAGVRSLSLTGVAVIFCSAVSVVTSEICRT